MNKKIYKNNHNFNNRKINYLLRNKNNFLKNKFIQKAILMKFIYK